MTTLSDELFLRLVFGIDLWGGAHYLDAASRAARPDGAEHRWPDTETGRETVDGNELLDRDVWEISLDELITDEAMWNALTNAIDAWCLAMSTAGAAHGRFDTGLGEEAELVVADAAVHTTRVVWTQQLHTLVANPTAETDRATTHAVMVPITERQLRELESATAQCAIHMEQGNGDGTSNDRGWWLPDTCR